MKQKRYPTALTIAGSDSGGGAGIQADLKTFSSIGVYGTSVITAVTAQNTRGVNGIQSISTSIIAAQADAVCSDIRVDAVKLGMLHAPEIVDTVATILEKYAFKTVITDPVMIATSGDSLILSDTVELYKTKLFPLTTLLTPNCMEAAVFTGLNVETADDLYPAGNALLRMGCEAVLMKGGHLEDEVMTDILFIRNEKPYLLQGPRITTPNTHGTGCTLSSAVAAYSALGHPLHIAVRLAKDYVHQAIVSGADTYVGAGHGPLNHFFNPQSLQNR